MEIPLIYKLVFILECQQHVLWFVMDLLKMLFETSANTSFLPINRTEGTASAPGYTFSAVQNSGIYYAGANQVAVSSVGMRIIGVDTNGVKFYNSISVYAPIVLQYYEEQADFSMTWNFDNRTAVANARFTRIGRQVFFQTEVIDFSTAPTTGSRWFSVTGAASQRFRHSSVIGFATAWVK